MKKPLPMRRHHPVLRPSDWKAIRKHISLGDEPWSSALKVFLSGYARPALSRSPSVYAGPYRGVEDWNHVFDTLNADGATARDLGIAYALTGDESYAIKCRQFLVAWAKGNTPTTQADCDKNDIGYHQSYGCFSFAYAYDLVYGRVSSDERRLVSQWFAACIDAIGSANAKIAADFYVVYPGHWAAYDWDAGKSYLMRDTYVGGDAALCGQAARLAMAMVTQRRDTVAEVLGTGVLGLPSMLASALSPLNDGDGMAGHPKPTPHVYIGGGYTPGRGGTLDYMTYNTRAAHVLVDMAANLGWPGRAVARAKLHTTWTYLGRFFGPGAEPDPNSADSVNVAANLPRFALPYHSFGDARFLAVLESGKRASYYEPQFLGPVTLTHSRSDTSRVALT